MKTKMQLLRSPEDLVKAYLCYYNPGSEFDKNVDVQEFLKNPSNKNHWRYLIANFFYGFKQRQKRVRCFLVHPTDRSFELAFTKDMVNFYSSIHLSNDAFVLDSKRDLSDFVEFEEIEEFI